MSKALDEHKKHKGKIQMCNKVKVNSHEDLSIFYSPGVAEPSLEISRDKKNTNLYTNRGNTIAVISDGSAVLGLGNIGPEASLPVMEGKALLFKEFANIDAIPIIIKTQDTEEIIKTIENISPSFSGINLEDISSPRCNEIEERLQDKLDIPVFHDDQHGTAIVVLAAIINACRLTKKKPSELSVLLIGTGAAGSSIARLIKKYGIKSINAFNKEGAVNKNKNNNFVIKDLLDKNVIDEWENEDLISAFEKKDIVIGVSTKNVIKPEMIRKMNKNPWVFALANPSPEIMPEIAYKNGAYIVGTGRSDYPNQINNLLAFPGVFRGLLDSNIKKVNLNIMIEVARSIANYIKINELNTKYILPSNLNRDIPIVIKNSIINYKEENNV